MSIHPTLTLAVYIGAAVAFVLIVAYMIVYSKRLKTPRGVGTNEGIAIATQEKERTGKTGSIS